MLAYQYNEDSKKFTNEISCQKDPLESEMAGKDIWLLPANSTWEKPLEPKDGFEVKFLEGKWQYEAIPEPEPEPEPTEDEKKQRVRYTRDAYLNAITWRIERYNEQTILGLSTDDTAETIQKIYEYRQYLRDYPESSETWYLNNPLTFFEWSASQIETTEEEM